MKSEELLKDLLIRHQKSRWPLPIADLKEDDLCSIASLQLESKVAKLLETEDEVKTCKSLQERQCKLIIDLIRKVAASAGDVESLIERKQKQQAEAEEKQRAKEEHVRLKQIEKDQKVAEKKEAGKTRKRGARSRLLKQLAGAIRAVPDPPPIMSDTSKATEMAVYNTDSEFEAAKVDPRKFLKAAPYVIKNCARLTTVINEPRVKSALQIYKLQYSKQDTVASSGRGRVPMASDRRSRVAELIKGYCVGDCTNSVGFTDGFVQKSNEVALVGCSWDMVHAAIERNGIGNARYQWCGQRSILAVRYEAIQILAKAKSMPMEPLEDVPSHMKKSDVDNGA